MVVSGIQLERTCVAHHTRCCRWSRDEIHQQAICSHLVQPPFCGAKTTGCCFRCRTRNQSQSPAATETETISPRTLHNVSINLTTSYDGSLCRMHRARFAMRLAHTAILTCVPPVISLLHQSSTTKAPPDAPADVTALPRLVLRSYALPSS